MPKLDLETLKERGSAVFNGFTRGQKTMLGLAVAAVLVGGFLFTQWSSKPSYTALQVAGILAMVALAATYFIPTFIAYSRRHVNRGAILLLNLNAVCAAGMPQ